MSLLSKPHTTLSASSFLWEVLKFVSFILTLQSACVSNSEGTEDYSSSVILSKDGSGGDLSGTLYSFFKHKWWSWITLYADRPLPGQCWPLHTLWAANLAQSCPSFVSVSMTTLMSFGQRSCCRGNVTVNFAAWHNKLQGAGHSASFHGCNFSSITLMIGSQSPWPSGARPCHFSLTSIICGARGLRERGWKHLYRGVTASENGCLCRTNSW